MGSPNTAPPHLPWSEALRAVKDVTVDSFDAVLRKSAMALVIFQAPWCAQCKQMAPDVAQVAAAFRSAVIVARVDAEGNDELLDRFDVASYPRILWFDGSNEWPFFASEVRKPEVYHGAKTFKAMATFLEARSGVRAGAREQPAELPPPPEPPPPSAPPAAAAARAAAARVLRALAGVHLVHARPPRQPAQVRRRPPRVPPLHVGALERAGLARRPPRGAR